MIRALEKMQEEECKMECRSMMKMLGDDVVRVIVAVFEGKLEDSGFFKRSCDDLDANILANSVKNIILDIRGLILCHSSCVKVLMHYLRDSVIRPQTEILINESIPWQRVSVRAIVPLVCNCLLTDEWSTDLYHLTVTDFTESPISSPVFSPAVSPAYSPTSPAYSATSSPAFSLIDEDAALEDTIHPSVI